MSYKLRIHYHSGEKKRLYYRSFTRALNKYVYYRNLPEVYDVSLFDSDWNLLNKPYFSYNKETRRYEHVI